MSKDKTKDKKNKDVTKDIKKKKGDKKWLMTR